jgi:CDP-glycerol glycerophosphotransferase (TagB/SpsB family)
MKKFIKKFKNVKPRDFFHLFLFVVALPASLIYRIKRKNLWLICDNGHEASDNGFVLFKYICEKHPEQDCVYAVYNSSKDYAKVKNTGNTVRYGSFMHWVLYLTARVNISSQKSGKPNYAVCNLLEVYGILKNNRVFLQHGVILTDIEFLYFENTKMSMFVTSTRREWEYVNSNYGYPEGVVKELGLPRFDELHGITPEKGQILIMPTWREWLGEAALSKNIKKDVAGFTETEYFRRWNEVVNSPVLKKLCEDKNLKIMFYLHRDAQRFADCFKTDNRYLTVCKYPEYNAGDLIRSAQFMITDYSSVQVDFAYMKKPLCYFHFDYERFSKEHYRKGYFNYETDGFGPVFEDAVKLAEYVSARAEKGFDNEDVYLKRHENFFDLYDTDNCKRNFEAIKGKWS